MSRALDVLKGKTIAGPFQHELPTVKGQSETIANALLIAAAPELLETLDMIAEDATNRQQENVETLRRLAVTWRTWAIDAIARAKGGAA